METEALGHSTLPNFIQLPGFRQYQQVPEPIFSQAYRNYSIKAPSSSENLLLSVKVNALVHHLAGWTLNCKSYNEDKSAGDPFFIRILLVTPPANIFETMST